MTSSATSPAAYPDCEKALEAALTHGTIELHFPSPNRAATFCARANRFRALLRANAAALGQPPTSPYDSLIIRHPKRGKTLVIEPRAEDFTVVIPGQGAVALDEATPPPTTLDYSDFLDDFSASLPPVAEEPEK